VKFPQILRHSYPGGDPREPLAIAREAETAGDLRMAATALDRAHGCAPLDADIAADRRRVLDSLAVEEYGASSSRAPRMASPMNGRRTLSSSSGISGSRRRRCPGPPSTGCWSGPLRDAPFRYEAKPMARGRYSLPTETQWEKAARGGLIGCRYPWGNEPPTAVTCDSGRFEPFVIQPGRTFAPNGYGLYAMSGSVWEWTSDYYSPRYNREGTGKDRVLRGGSWADPANVITVSFRMPRDDGPRTPSSPTYIAPNIGFRLCRQERDGRGLTA
jgi:hypothetical protein